MTNRRGIEVIELHALPGKPVDVRRGVRFTTITADRFTPHVIGKDQDDVRTIFPKGGVQQRGKGKQRCDDPNHGEELTRPQASTKRFSS